jgi:Fibronectin type III-like domain
VCNTGTRAGSEVVQLYVHDEGSTLIRPPQELKAFAKVALQPEQAQTVSLTLSMRAFAAYDDVRHAWVAESRPLRGEVGPIVGRHPPARLGDVVDRMGPAGQPRTDALQNSVLSAIFLAPDFAEARLGWLD